MKEYKEVKSLEINIQDYIPVHQRPQLEQREENSIGEQEFILSKPVIINEAKSITEESNECQVQKEPRDEDIINDISDILDDDDIDDIL